MGNASAVSVFSPYFHSDLSFRTGTVVHAVWGQNEISIPEMLASRSLESANVPWPRELCRCEQAKNIEVSIILGCLGGCGVITMVMGGGRWEIRSEKPVFRET